MLQCAMVSKTVLLATLALLILSLFSLGNIVSFVAGAALTWSSPTLSKFNSTDSSINPFDGPTTENQNSWISSLLALGASFGPFIFAFLADSMGRKRTIISIAITFVHSSFLMAFSKSVKIFYVARFICGLAVGGTFTVIPMYMGEIAEDSNRGAVGSILNIFITGGLLFTYCLGPYTSIMVFNIVLGVIPIVYLGIFIVFAPESPYYLLNKGRNEDAKLALEKLRGVDAENEKELEFIQASLDKAGNGSLLDLFRSRRLLKALGISVALVSFQQFSGINAVLFYSETIFQASGSSIAPEVAAIIVGAVQFCASFVTPFAADRLGRKPLLYISAIGMFISEVPLGFYFYLQDNGNNVDAISWLPVVSLVCYIITYTTAFGPLPWAIMGEIFPSNVKSIASSVTAFICWFLGFLITKFFPSISKSMGMGESFWLFSGFCALALFFTYFFVFETKGKSLQDIQDQLN